MSDNKYRRRSVSMPDEMWAALEKNANGRRGGKVSVSYVVREAVNRYFVFLGSEAAKERMALMREERKESK